MRVLMALITVGITIYAFVDCLRCRDDEVRNLPRPLWLALTLIPLLGGLAWLAFGRPSNAPGAPTGAPFGSPAAPRPSRPLAPDDDPEFLLSLDQTVRERRRQAAEEARRRRAEEARRRQAERDAGKGGKGTPRPGGGAAGPDDEPGARQTPA